MRSHFIAAIGVMLCAAASFRGANVRLDPARLPADNTRQNLRIVQTAQSQSNDRADRLIAARVRRVLMADDSLSLYGKNVKIIVASGKVTLEGPVHSQNERLQVAFDAATIVGPQEIDDRITVA